MLARNASPLLEYAQYCLIERLGDKVSPQEGNSVMPFEPAEPSCEPLSFDLYTSARRLVASGFRGETSESSSDLACAF